MLAPDRWASRVMASTASDRVSAIFS